MNEKLLKYPGSKWTKHVVLWKDTAVRSYLPGTDRFHKNSLRKYLDKFPVLFLKPTLGGGGRGVIRISRVGKQYVLRTAGSSKVWFDLHLLYRALQRIIQGRSYIVQQGIDLISIDQRPMDFRVLLLKPAEQWEFIGVMGKLAAKHKYVTNHCRGGTPISLNHALQRSLHLPSEKCAEIENKLQELATLVADQLNRHFQHIRELGLDVAIDANQQIWLIEANTKPHFHLFKAHEDKQLFTKIKEQIYKLRKQ
ncbi:MAG TPA: YheC/YheD family protein [Bacilli bacterium]